MEQTLSEQLKEQEKGILQYKTYECKINDVQEQWEEQKREVKKLENRALKEQEDVDVLEKRGLQAFYLRIRGQYEETKDKELLEAAQANVKLEEAKVQLELLAQRITELRKEQQQYEGCQEKYEELFEKKKQKLLVSNTEEALEYLEHQKKVVECEHRIKEIDEATAAGNRVKSCLRSAKESLESAENYGTWDLLGGGFAADMMKHSAIDDAKERISKAQSALRAFRTELADVRMTVEVSINTDGFAKFADIWFDDIFSDWNMQNQVKKGLQDVIQSIGKVTNILGKLALLKRSMEEELRREEKKMDALILDE